MTNELYKDIIEKQIEKCKELLISKGIEYHKDKDPLHNFNVGGAIIGKTPKEALAGYMMKHTISIYDMITSGEKYPIEKWEEKITDHINYLLILKACIIEELNGDNKIDDIKRRLFKDTMNETEDKSKAPVIHITDAFDDRILHDSGIVDRHYKELGYNGKSEEIMQSDIPITEYEVVADTSYGINPSFSEYINEKP